VIGCARRGRRVEARIGSPRVGVVVVVATVALCASRAAPCAPRVAVATRSLDAGTVVAGDRVRRTVAVRNDGDAPLALTASAAKPLAVRVDPVVPAGATGRLRLELDTVGLAGPAELPVRLATDDPTAPHVGLTVRVDVRHHVVATPGRARWVVVRGAGPVTVPQRLRALDGQAFRVREARSPVGALRVVPPDGPPRAAWTVGLTLGPEAGVGALAGTVELALDHPRQRRLAIPVSGFVRPVVAVTPPALTVADAGGPWRARLHVRSFAEEPLELRRATTDVAGLSLAVDAVEAGRAWLIRVSGPPTPAAGTIRVETSSPVEPVVEVAVRRRAGP
jgi:hypothetical protein